MDIHLSLEILYLDFLAFADVLCWGHNNFAIACC